MFKKILYCLFIFVACNRNRNPVTATFELYQNGAMIYTEKQYCSNCNGCDDSGIARNITDRHGVHWRMIKCEESSGAVYEYKR